MTEIKVENHIGMDRLIFSPETHIARTPIDGVLIIKRPRNFDDRGSLQEIFRRDDIYRTINEPSREILQAQFSYSDEGVLRGMHAGPEDKFILPSIGSFFVALVDVRKNSPTFGKHITFDFNATDPTSNEPQYAYFVRRGIANGFMVRDTGPLNKAQYIYSVTCEYNQDTSKGFKFDDSEVGIKWPNSLQPQISPKDMIQPSFSEFISVVNQEMYE